MEKLQTSFIRKFFFYNVVTYFNLILFSSPEPNIEWKKSDKGTGFWARNCDFEGKSNEKNGITGDDCFRQCEIENGKQKYFISTL